MVSFQTLRERARKTPIISDLPKLSSFYLSECNIYGSIEQFHQDLYDPDYRFDQDVIINADTYHPNYPRVECTADPLSSDLNTVVNWTRPDDHATIQAELVQQSNIKQHITNRAIGEDLIALVIVDGLSYATARNFPFDVQPVMVDGITTTEPGFRRIIYGDSNLSIYGELSQYDFFNVYGFTYWDRGQEALSTELHRAIGDNVYRINDFENVLERLEAEAPFSDKTYVQITRMGFDQECHNRKEEPNREAVRNNLLSDIQSLAETLERISVNARLFLTSDHGILWRDQLPDDPPVICDEWHNHARFLQGNHNVEQGMVQDRADKAVTGLGYPALTRELKNTEWGVHGGFSYYESITPFIDVSIPGDLT